MNLYKYRIWCETEVSWVYVWASETPTTCPNNNTHIIDPSKTVISQKKKDVGPVDVSDKPRVQQTSRKLGLRTMWSGIGDNPADLHSVGEGTQMTITHIVGEPDPEDTYIDYNIVENETWLHEGYITWKDCNMDTLTLEMISRATATQAGTNTNYNLYGGSIIIPAAGNGVIDITADITNPNNGLIFMPNNDLGEPPTAFWNADYNSTTKLYENMTPAPSGNGRYNMFTQEYIFARFVNKMPLLSSGFLPLNSSDTDEMGHGMRLKIITKTNPLIADHDWSIACLMCLHRDRSI